MHLHSTLMKIPEAAKKTVAFLRDLPTPILAELVVGTTVLAANAAYQSCFRGHPARAPSGLEARTPEARMPVTSTGPLPPWSAPPCGSQRDNVPRPDALRRTGSRRWRAAIPRLLLCGGSR